MSINIEQQYKCHRCCISGENNARVQTNHQDHCDGHPKNDHPSPSSAT